MVLSQISLHDSHMSDHPTLRRIPSLYLQGGSETVIAKCHPVTCKGKICLVGACVPNRECDKCCFHHWAVYYAKQNRGKQFEVTISALIPLIRIQAHTVATIKYAMEKIHDSEPFLNPGHTPFRASGQSLHIKWQWHDYGEDTLAVMFRDSILKVQR